MCYIRAESLSVLLALRSLTYTLCYLPLSGRLCINHMRRLSSEMTRTSLGKQDKYWCQTIDTGGGAGLPGPWYSRRTGNYFNVSKAEKHCPWLSAAQFPIYSLVLLKTQYYGKQQTTKSLCKSTRAADFCDAEQEVVLQFQTGYFFMFFSCFFGAGFSTTW